jgi:hypothetical protein
MAMLVLLLVCVPLFYMWRLGRGRNPWPRIFLAGIARLAGVRVIVSGQPVVRGTFLLANRDTGSLTIFPEGTTGDGTTLLPFKSSLLSALDPLPEGIVVRPVLLDYGAEAADIAWVGEEPGLENFQRILARGRPVTLTVHLLPPLTGEALANRKTITAAARDALAARLRDSVSG